MSWLKEIFLNIPFTQETKDKCTQFRDETRCVLALYQRFFGKYKNEKCTRLVFICVDVVTKTKISRYEGGIYEKQIQFPVDRFFSSTDYEKKVLTLQGLKDGLDLIIQELNWDPEPFENAYKKVIECNYENTWYWNKPLRSPDKKHCAVVYCEHKVKSFDIYIIITSQKGEVIKRQLVVSETPFDFLFSLHLGKLVWASDNEVVLYDVLYGVIGENKWNVYI